MKKKQTKYESALDIAVSPRGGTNSRECGVEPHATWHLPRARACALCRVDATSAQMMGTTAPTLPSQPPFWPCRARAEREESGGDPR